MKTRSIGWTTWVLVASAIAVFVLELRSGQQGLEALFGRFGLVPVELIDALDHSPERIDRWLIPLVASMFLHAGWAHLIGNMIFLAVFGRVVEARLGHASFFWFYVVCGMVATLTHVAMEPQSALPLVGASGAIAGVLGGVLATHPRAKVTVVIPIVVIPFFRKVSAFAFLFLWFLQQVVAGTVGRLWVEADGGVAFWAHVGGFVAGFVLLPLWVRIARG